MKFDCGETWIETKERKSNWHRFFCLFPRKVSDHDCRWLEYVERKGTYYSGYAYCGWSWRYRSLDEQVDTT